MAVAAMEKPLLQEREFEASPVADLEQAASGTAGRRTWGAFWILGLLNNLGYVVVISGAKSLADSHNKPNLVGAVSWSLVGLGVAVRAINAALEGSSVLPRTIAASVAAAVGLVLLGKE